MHGRGLAGYSISHKNGCDKYPPRLFFYKINENIINNVEKFHRLVEADDNKFTEFKGEVASILPKSFYQDGSYIDNSSKRQKDIFQWLLNSNYRINFHGTKSFAIKNRVVNLKSQGEKTIIDWLSEEGFVDLNCISGYVVKAYDKDSPKLKRLIFVKIQEPSTNLQER